MSILEEDDEETSMMIRRIRAMWASEGSGGYDNYPGVVCPYCETTDASYVHFEHPQYYPGNDRSDASHIYDIGVRGDVMVLPFWCEKGHNWVLVLGAHKGSISCKIELLRTQDNERTCGYTPDKESSCQNTATITIPYKEGTVYLCEYHLGLLIGAAINTEQEPEP